MNFSTSTPINTEGFSISYSMEKKLSEDLLKKLPEDWKVHWDWVQILFSDIQYRIDRKNKTIFFTYNQDVHHWWKELEKELLTKIKTS